MLGAKESVDVDSIKLERMHITVVKECSKQNIKDDGKMCIEQSTQSSHNDPMSSTTAEFTAAEAAEMENDSSEPPVHFVTSSRAPLLEKHCNHSVSSTDKTSSNLKNIRLGARSGRLDGDGLLQAVNDLKAQQAQSERTSQIWQEDLKSMVLENQIRLDKALLQLSEILEAQSANSKGLATITATQRFFLDERMAAAKTGSQGGGVNAVLPFRSNGERTNDLVTLDSRNSCAWPMSAPNQSLPPTFPASESSLSECEPSEEQFVAMAAKPKLQSRMSFHDLETAVEKWAKHEMEVPHWVDSRTFNVAIGLAVFLNALQLGIEIDVELGLFGEYLENLFCACWVIEAIARMRAYGLRRYFSECWNLLDFSLAALSVVDVWILQNVSGSAVNLKSVAVLRALRLVRLVRLVKALRAIKELWLLVDGLRSALSVLCWVFILFAIIIYVGAICSATVIGTRCEALESAEEVDDCTLKFGSLLASMLTLFQIMTFDDWSEVLRMVMNVVPGMVIFILLFILLTSFGLVNVVMGVIVEQTMKNAKHNEERLAKLRETQQRKDVAQIMDIFKQADEDGDGTLSMDEFVHMCQRKDVQDMFETLDLPVSRQRLAIRLFQVLDGNMKGEMKIGDFVTATMRLKKEGLMLHKDPTLLLMETRHLARQLTRVENEMGTLPYLFNRVNQQATLAAQLPQPIPNLT